MFFTLSMKMPKWWVEPNLFSNLEVLLLRVVNLFDGWVLGVNVLWSWRLVSIARILYLELNLAWESFWIFSSSQRRRGVLADGCSG